MTTEPVTTLHFDPSTGTSQNTSTFKTVASLGAVDYNELPDTTHWVWFSCKIENSGDNAMEARVVDGAGSALASVNPSGSGACLVAATPVSTNASTLTEYEFEIQSPSGGTTSLIGSFTVNVWVGRR